MKPAAIVTATLGGLAVLLGGLLALQFTGVGSGIDGAEPPEPGVSMRPGPEPVAMAAQAGLKPYKEYDAITDRPLFNENREPWVPPPEVAIEDPDENETDVEAVELDVRLTGVIISPAMRIALLSDNKSKQSMAVREGMPLEGPLGEWEVESIAPRRVDFRSSLTAKVAEVELSVNGAALAGGAPAPTRTAVNANTDSSEDISGDLREEQDAESRAEELRRKVAERRAQLRAEAARRAEENNN